MTQPAPVPHRAVKKGIVSQTIWSNRELTQAQELAAIAALKPGWQINYLPTRDITPPGVEFYPMIFDAAHATAPNLALAAAYDTKILGFNEPDNPFPQANMTPAAAAALWPLFTATGVPLASPVTATGDPSIWLPTFETDLGAVRAVQDGGRRRWRAADGRIQWARARVPAVGSADRSSECEPLGERRALPGRRARLDARRPGRNLARYLVGDGSKIGVDCYLSGDGGATARLMRSVVAGDLLYWNGTIAGFQLSAADRIDLGYDVAA